MIGVIDSNLYGEHLFVFGKASKSVGFSKKSDMALTGVIKLCSREDVDLSTLLLFLAAKEIK